MKNITEQKPTDALHGRTAFTVKFVEDKDLKDKKILDIGSGYGWFELHCLVKGAKHVTGIEIEEKDLVTAKKYIKNKQIDFEKGSATDIPLKNDSVDTVVSFEVIEHIPKNTEYKMFKEVNRVLKSGGAFYLSTPHRSVISTLLDPAWWLIGHRHYQRQELTKFANKTGFKVEKTTIRGGWYEVIWLLNLYISKWIFRRKPLCELYFQQKLTKEFQEKEGFTNIYFKFIKLHE
jgi:ubiquinone/menaquinone biosynthesis C-methylase UbiE